MSKKMYLVFLAVIIVFGVVGLGAILLSRSFRHQQQSKDKFLEQVSEENYLEPIVTNPVSGELELTYSEAIALEAFKMKTNWDVVHIYTSTNGFEVWLDDRGINGGREHVGTGETLEKAREIVNRIYLSWAKERVGPMPDGKRVE